MTSLKSVILMMIANDDAPAYDVSKFSGNAETYNVFKARHAAVAYCLFKARDAADVFKVRDFSRRHGLM